LSKSHYETKLWVSQNIFAGLFNFWIFRLWPYPRQNPMYWPQALAWQASPWKHDPSSSAPCAAPMRLSRIDQHIKDEPCAKQRALLGVSSSRYSSVSRGVRSAVPIFTFSPLVDNSRFRILTRFTILVTNIHCTGPCNHYCILVDLWGVWPEAGFENWSFFCHADSQAFELCSSWIGTDLFRRILRLIDFYFDLMNLDLMKPARVWQFTLHGSRLLTFSPLVLSHAIENKNSDFVMA
jgi:hypothetical protein